MRPSPSLAALSVIIAITAVWLIAGRIPLRAAEPMTPGQIEVLVEGGYEDRVHDLLDRAQQEIVVVMYLANLPADARPSHPVRRLLDHLIAERKRGISVRVLLDAGAPPDEGRPNQAAADLLAAGGVDVRWDEDDRTTHIKAVIIDGRWSVVGSTNWTASALRHNREMSLACDDAALAQRVLAQVATAWAAARPVR